MVWGYDNYNRHNYASLISSSRLEQSEMERSISRQILLRRAFGFSTKLQFARMTLLGSG